MKEASRDKSNRIDLNDKTKCEQWMRKLNITHEQLREAVGAVGDDASDVEMHLRGSHATTNEERMKRAGKKERPS